MKHLLLGFAVALALLAGGAYLYLRLGFLDLRADTRPSAFENGAAMSFMDASTERHAPDRKNPFQPTEPNLLEGMKLYRDHCALCHGAPGRPERNFGHPFYPPAPQFMEDAPDMPENQNFFIIQHGVRWTGMPAWRNTLSDEQIWKVVTFLAHMDRLPPAVDDAWKKLLP